MAFNFPFRLLGKDSLLGALFKIESGGRNIVQGNIGDINNRTGDLAKGYFQITDATWRDYGGLKTGYTRADAAPYEVQAQIASRIPLRRWGPATLKAMEATGKKINTNWTLGENLYQQGESTTPPVTAATANVDDPMDVGGIARGAKMAAQNAYPPAPVTPGGIFPDMPELKGDDKDKSLGGLLGELIKPPPKPENISLQVPQQPQSQSLGEYIQQYLSQRLLKPGGGGPMTGGFNG